MKQLSALLCSLSLCSLLFCILLLLLPLQPSEKATAASEGIEQILFSLTPQELDRIYFKKKDQSYCLINLGDRFALEGHESLLLDTAALTSLLERFPLAAIDPNRFLSSDINIEIVSPHDDTFTLSIQYGDQDCLLSNGTQTYCYSTDILEPLLTDPVDLVDRTVTCIEFPQQAAMTLSGALHDEPLQLSYYIEEQDFAFCGNDEAAPDLILPLFDKLCRLSADRVELIDPSADDLRFAGLDSPFLILNAQLGTEPFFLSFSKPQSDGTVYFIKEGSPLLFSASLSDLPFLSVTEETLLEESLFLPKYPDTTSVAVSAEGQSYRFTKWAGQVLCQGSAVDEDHFYDFYQLCCTLVPKQALLLENDHSASLLHLEFSYTNPQQKTDQIEFFSYDNESCILAINGEQKFLVENRFVEEILSTCRELIQ